MFQMSDQRRFIIVFVIGTLIIFSSLGSPNEWSLTHYLFSYDLGLVRRSLVGSLVTQTSGSFTASSIALLASTITIWAAFAFVIFCTRIFLAANLGIGLPLVATTSFALVAFVGSTGYLDGVTLLLALLGLCLPVSGYGIAMRSVVLCAGALVHETMLPLFGMLFAADIWLGRKDLLPARRAIAALAPVLLCSALVAGLFLNDKPFEMSAEIESSLQTRAVDFRIRDLAVEAVLDRTNGESETMSRRWHSVKYQYEMTRLFPVVVSWTIVFLALLFHSGARLVKSDRAALLFGAIAPFSLHLVAFDASRFLALGVMIAFLTLAVGLRRRADEFNSTSKVFSGEIIAVFMAVNIFIELVPLNVEAYRPSGLPVWVGR